VIFLSEKRGIMRISFAGNKPISQQIRRFIRNYVNPILYLHDIWDDPDLIEKLKDADLDYIICVHFPKIIPKKILYGVLNLHPSYLPYNRGWHTPTWAIIDGTPAGATLHFMDEKIDHGDIVDQKRVPILPTDTAQDLYQRILVAEYDVFEQAWPSLIDRTYKRKPQNDSIATYHKKSDLQKIKNFLDADNIGFSTIQVLRALTTNDIKEACYYKIDGQKYAVQVNIKEVE